MKRLLAFFVCGGMIFLFSLFGDFDLLGHDKISKVCVVSSCEVANIGNVVKSGNQFYYTGSSEQIKSEFKNFDNIDGLILYFSNCELNEITSYYKADFYRGGDVEGMQVYYGYTPYYKDSRDVNNKKINMQIVVCEEEIIVGFPAILTGF